MLFAVLASIDGNGQHVESSAASGVRIGSALLAGLDAYQIERATEEKSLSVGFENAKLRLPLKGAQVRLLLPMLNRSTLDVKLGGISPTRAPSTP